MTSLTTPRTEFPESIYKFTTQPNDPMADGELPITRELVESIAARKPSWARFEDTDIGGCPVLDYDPEFVVSWAREFGGDVGIYQDVVFNVTTQHQVREGAPHVLAMIDDWRKLTAQEARRLAAKLLAAATDLEKIEAGEL